MKTKMTFYLISVVALTSCLLLADEKKDGFIVGGNGKRAKRCEEFFKCCPRKRKEPTGIQQFFLETSGNIDQLAGFPAPVLPANVAYLAKGNPDNPIAFCMHGFPDTAESMRFLLDDLSEKGFYAVAPFLRGYAPTEIQSPLPQPGLVALYVIQDQLELLTALGAFAPSRFGKNVFIGHDWGALYGPVIVNLSIDPLGNNAFEKYVGLAIPNPPVLNMLQTTLGNFEATKNLFHVFFFNITPRLGIFQENVALDAIPPTNTARFRQFDMLSNFWKTWSPTANKADQQVDIVNAEKAVLSDLTNLNLEMAISFYYDLFVVGLPNFPLSVPAQFGFGLEDGVFQQPPGDLTLEEYVDLITATSPAGAKVFFSKCGGHFLHLDDTRFVNKQILCFIKEENHKSLSGEEKKKLYDDAMDWCRTRNK